MQGDRTPAQQADHRRDLRGENWINGIVILLFIVAVILAWIYFVVPAKDAGAQEASWPDPMYCPGQTDAPNQSGNYLNADFSWRCDQSTVTGGVRSVTMTAVFTFQVEVNGHWQQYSNRGHMKRTHGAPISYSPERDHCYGGSRHTYRERIVTRVEYFRVGPDFPTPEYVTRRRVFYRATTGYTPACDENEPG
jgi:hypothetical protein